MSVYRVGTMTFFTKTGSGEIFSFNSAVCNSATALVAPNVPVALTVTPAGTLTNIPAIPAPFAYDAEEFDL
jgi:hypothetical protein